MNVLDSLPGTASPSSATGTMTPEANRKTPPREVPVVLARNVMCPAWLRDTSEKLTNTPPLVPGASCPCSATGRMDWASEAVSSDEKMRTVNTTMTSGWTARVLKGKVPLGLSMARRLLSNTLG